MVETAEQEIIVNQIIRKKIVLKIIEIFIIPHRLETLDSHSYSALHLANQN